MPQRVFKLYQRKRVININVNIFLAGLIAIAIAKYPISVLSAMIGHEHKLVISVFSYALDTVIDVFVYFGLHWIANQWRPMKRLDPEPDQADTDAHEPKPKKFLMDAGKVQAERFALVPIFAVLATGGMWWLQRQYHVEPGWAFVIAFVFAMLVTRVIHTVWGYRSGTFRDEGRAVGAEDGSSSDTGE